MRKADATASLLQKAMKKIGTWSPSRKREVGAAQRIHAAVLTWFKGASEADGFKSYGDVALRRALLSSTFRLLATTLRVGKAQDEDQLRQVMFAVLPHYGASMLDHDRSAFDLFKACEEQSQGRVSPLCVGFAFGQAAAEAINLVSAQSSGLHPAQRSDDVSRLLQQNYAWLVDSSVIDPDRLRLPIPLDREVELRREVKEKVG